MLYTYCKDSLSFKKVTPTKKIGGVFLIISLICYIALTSMVSNARDEGFKSAMNKPIESELVVLDSSDVVFSQDALVKELKKLNVRFPHIVLAQSILETGHWESRIYQENNNLFGMKQARQRVTTALGTNLNHAYYNNWKESVLDYAMFQAAYLRDLKTEEAYLLYLDKNYAMASNYDIAVKKMVEREGLKELFE